MYSISVCVPMYMLIKKESILCALYHFLLFLHTFPLCFHIFLLVFITKYSLFLLQLQAQSSTENELQNIHKAFFVYSVLPHIMGSIWELAYFTKHNGLQITFILSWKDSISLFLIIKQYSILYIHHDFHTQSSVYENLGWFHISASELSCYKNGSIDNSLIC